MNIDTFELQEVKAAAADTPGLQIGITGLTKRFGERQVLHGLDLDIDSGQFVAIVGRSGCGKSTLLRLLAGLDSPSGGIIRLDRRDVARNPAQARDHFIFEAARSEQMCERERRRVRVRVSERASERGQANARRFESQGTKAHTEDSKQSTAA